MNNILKPFKRLFKKPKDQLNQTLVFIDDISKCAKSALMEFDTQFTSSTDQARLLWFRKNYKPYYKLLKQFQSINHIPGESSMVNKGKLTKNLIHYDKISKHSNQLKLSQFYQESYCLYDQKSSDAFINKIPSTDQKENLWILKPDKLSKGRGIVITWQLNQLKEQIKKQSKDGKLKFNGYKPYRYIAQRYIKNPLLLNNRKSEIRVYWLIANLNPLMVLLYHQGTVRLNTKAFKLSNFDDPLIHVTNMYQQKRHSNLPCDIALKWSFDQLNDYLYKNNMVSSKNFTNEILMPKVKDTIAYVTYAIKNKLNTKEIQGHYFGLYGADLILDSNLTPWLSEIQKGPGLSWSDPIKCNIIPPMLKEMVDIILEIQNRKQAKLSVDNLSSPNGFQWVINEANL